MLRMNVGVDWNGQGMHWLCKKVIWNIGYLVLALVKREARHSRLQNLKSRGSSVVGWYVLRTKYSEL